MPVRTLRKPLPRIRVENVRPQLDCGRFPVKRTVGERVEVSATVIRDGHDILGASVLYREAGKRRFEGAPLEPIGNDVFAGSFTVTSCGRWEYLVEAWSDRVATWRDELRRKVEAGQEDLAGELAEGEQLLGIPQLDVETALASTASDRQGATRSDLYAVEVDRELARFGAWYELFPRSFGGFAGVERVLPQLAELGFDVVYLPPIHPIGRSGRKGPNNTLPAKKGDPGSPWAIGAKEGGHTAIHPDLGTIALDFAIQCSPDHPWLTEHPEWFQHRPDGTIKYAENPPKRYQDIVNVDWESEDWQGLWEALRDVVLYWVGHGVHVFRVDNPHTKPLSFWEWLIADVRREHPDVVFLAEAFTRPAMMRALAKIGFDQSYTYFTWKNTRAEIEEYVTELATETAEYYRPNFFANTPDILHEYLQRGGRPAFEARLILAATLSPSYGIYSGYERCENVPLRPRSEEYLDSEKYEVKERELEGPLLPLIGRLNEIRRANRSLQRVDNIRFLETANDSLLAYVKQSPSDTLVVTANLDPVGFREGLVTVPPEVGLPGSFAVQDLLSDDTYAWRTGGNFVRLAPGQAHILHAR
jgi:starch synthase (maltosyl-transferring)